MLRLVRTQHNRDITIRLRGRDPILSPNLRVALAIAFFLHIGAVGIFSIRGSQAKEYAPIPPIVVETELGGASHTQTGTLLPSVSMEGLLPRYVLEPEAPTPDFPTMPKGERHRMKQEKGLHLADRKFLQLEEREYQATNPGLNFIKSYEPVRVHISGALASFGISNNGLSIINDALKRRDPLRQYSIKYKVQMDGKTGQIFWFEKVMSSGEAELDILAEDIVRQMRFSRAPKAFFVDGEVQIFFTVTPSESYRYLISHEAILDGYMLPEVSNLSAESTGGEP